MIMYSNIDFRAQANSSAVELHLLQRRTLPLHILEYVRTNDFRNNNIHNSNSDCYR